MYRFELRFAPVAKGRPRFNMKTGSTYTPKRTDDFEKEIKKEVERTLGSGQSYPVFFLAETLAVDLDFVFKRPSDMETHPEKYGIDMKWRGIGEDIDNLIKSILDALNGVLWEDDKQVVAVRARKFVAERGSYPRICVYVRPAGPVPEFLCDAWGEDLELNWLKIDRIICDPEYAKQFSNRTKEK